MPPDEPRVPRVSEEQLAGLANHASASFRHPWPSVGLLIADLLDARRALAAAEASAGRLRGAAEDFVAKVERGEARSRDSYAKFKAALADSDGAAAARVIEVAKRACIWMVRGAAPAPGIVEATVWLYLDELVGAVHELNALAAPTEEGKS